MPTENEKKENLASPSPVDQPVEALKETKAKKQDFPSEQDIKDVLSSVEDPELHINIIDLGLIYKIHRDPPVGYIEVDMTLTSPACPYAPMLLKQTHAVLTMLPQVKKVKINTVWTPHWDPRKHATDVGQMMLGLI